MRELNRGGQIFFVHNRVEDIHVVATRLGQIVPEARLRVAHGQMPEHELERVMLDFVAHRFDLLLATTIVESGLDIPNANTIFIDEADRYGLADLHQLRGRVGRYKHRAYCHLLLDPNKNLSPSAAKAAAGDRGVQRHGRGLRHRHARPGDPRGGKHFRDGAERAHRRGRLRDVLRAAGTGRRSTEEFAAPGGDRGRRRSARQRLHPRAYVPDMRLKIDLYRRLARVSTRTELDDFIVELRDRFGPPPTEVEHILWLAGLRIAAHDWQIQAIHLEDQYVVFGYASERKIHELAAQSGGVLRVVDAPDRLFAFGRRRRLAGGDPQPSQIAVAAEVTWRL